MPAARAALSQLRWSNFPFRRLRKGPLLRGGLSKTRGVLATPTAPGKPASAPVPGLVLAEDHAELDGLALGIPASVLGGS